MSEGQPSEELEELAHLARLRPTRAADQQPDAAFLDRLLRHFAVLAEVDTEDVAPSAYPLPIPARTRTDDPGEPLPKDEVLRNAPAQRGDCFVVPRVIEDPTREDRDR